MGTRTFVEPTAIAPVAEGIEHDLATSGYPDLDALARLMEP
ncbi:MAG: hypothetical protein WAM30_05050 [Candidatus Dormiibacterota bacterium]